MLRRGRCFALSYWASTPIGTSISATVPRFFFLYKLTVGRVKLKLLKMKKVMFTALAVGLCLSANVMAQVPSYVPTNGLVGYWPFNGNANDESGNSINGLVSNASLSTDRFSNMNSAYSFYGSGDYIEIPTNGGEFDSQIYTLSFWFKSNQGPSSGFGGPNVNPAIISRLNTGGPTSNSGSVDNFVIYEISGSSHFNTPVNGGATGANTILGNVWKNIVFTVRTDSTIVYLNGVKLGANINNGNITFQSYPIRLGRSQHTYWRDFSGELDDLGYWNRALTQQEITALYSGCGNEITTQPINAFNSVGTNPQFSVNSVVGSSFQWQSNPLSLGWQNISDNSVYNGSTTNTLTVANVQLSNHNQPFRVIASASNCTDTSNIATIQITDTCITNVTVYDTLLTTVTDTLIINTTLSLPAPNNENTILIYPNPASDHITIDNGNYTAMAGYTIKIENNAGQQVFQSLINQAQFYVDLSTWSGDGLYFVHLIDAQGNTVTVRKIVLQ